MSTGRLTFLYPHLLRTTRSSVTHNTLATRWVATTRSNSSFAPRHGKAVEPTWDTKEEEAAAAAAVSRGQPPEKRTLLDGNEVKGGPVSGMVEADGLVVKQRTKKMGKTKKSTQTPQTGHTGETLADVVASSVAPLEKTGSDEPQQTTKTPAGIASASDKTPEPPQQKKLSSAAPAPHVGESSPSPSPSLDAAPLLRMPLPDKTQHPHMTPPPYVHHFDSYSMVRLLEEGGYTRDQAVSSMKAIRTILAGNLQVAQKSLVSKGDVENETYLFHAACSELRTEIKNNRRLQDEQMRQQRTHLQHEVDILTQTLNQELLTLNDGVKGLFNDRNMTVREEQKAVESAIQQINYRMSIILSSDSKSEIEGVRWILIRRSVVGLLFLAVLTLGMIRYTTYLAQQKKKDAERRRKERERLRRDGGRTDNSSSADAAVILSAS
ncbi:hypothetical protein E4U21_001189 [Claviceps maximensis]|nr:hypothetical protein E4U21_001189 [Claviceps maximensis]